MELEPLQATLTIDGEHITIGVPFVKINAEQRIVEGFATLDNEDKTGEILDKDASLEAFGQWAGNVREMHQKVAVGKALQVEPREYEDPKTGQVFNGIWVKARISKGAPDTWEKIMDGTLTGFSVGGATLERQQRLNKMSGRAQPVVTKYRLSELSVVDNPCNGLAEFALIKSFEATEVLEDGEFEKSVSTPLASEGVEKMTETNEEELAKAAKQAIAQMAPPYTEDSAHSSLPDAHAASDHYGAAVSHLQAAATHASADDDHHGAADAHRMAANVADMAKQSKYKEAIAATEGPINKSTDATEGEEKFQNNINSDKSILGDLTNEDLNKFVEFAKGLNTATEQKVEPVVSEELNKGDDTEMNEETLTKALSEMTDNITKMLSEKVDGVGTDLDDIKKRFDAVATSEAVDELKKELETVTGRVSALEDSGAIQKSGEAAGEKLEKSAGAKESLWADSIVPSILKDRFSGK